MASIYGSNSNDNNLRGTLADDQIYGLDGWDVIYAGQGNDFVDGGNGSDMLYGEDGNDTILGGAGEDGLDGGAGNDVLDGGANIDMAYFSSIAAAVNANLTTGIATGQGTDTLINIENLWGSSMNDVFTGNGGNNQLYGNNGNDTLFATLGVDILNGGAGTDTVNFSDVNAVNANLTSGAYSVNATNYGTLVGIENLTGGQGNDVLTGNTLANVLDGGAGADRLAGGAGNDTLWGGMGADRLIADGGADTLTGNSSMDGSNDAAADIFEIRTAATIVTITDFKLGVDKLDLTAFGFNAQGVSAYWSGVGVQDGPNAFITLTGLGAERVTINLNGISPLPNLQASLQLSDMIGGSANLLPPLPTNLTLGATDDTIHTGAGNDVVDGGYGNDMLFGDGGWDQIFGNDGNDTLDGGTGNDTLDGGAGNDTVSFASLGANAYGGVYANLATGVVSSLATGAVTELSGSDTLLNIENIYGSNRNDIFNGSNGDNRIDGNNGNDLIYASLGVDQLDGGAGIDGVVFSGLGVIADLSAGVYTIDANNYGSLTNMEELYGTLNGDTLIGNGANNRLDGDAGNDTLAGGAGNDELWGGKGSDRLIADGGADYLNGNFAYRAFTADGAADIFEIRTNATNVTIADFKMGVDKLDLTAFGFDSNGVSPYWSGAATQSGPNTILTLNGLASEQVTVTLNGVGEGYKLQASDMISGSASLIPPAPTYPMNGGDGVYTEFIVTPQSGVHAISYAGFENGLDKINIHAMLTDGWRVALSSQPNDDTKLHFTQGANVLDVTLTGQPFYVMDQTDYIL